MTKDEYTYEEIFERNIGVFTEGEQKKIRNLKVAIAGAGGLGGPVAYNLAKLGVGEIRIADADKFEASNINRQFGAYIDTIGQNKAEAIAAELKRINPYLNLVVVPEMVTRGNIDSFLEGVDVAVDAIDFFELNEDYAFLEESCKRNIWVFTSQAAKEILSFTAFNPEKQSHKRMLTVFGKPNLLKSIKSYFPKLPRGIKFSAVKDLVINGQVHISSHTTPPNIGAGLVVEEIIKVIVRGEKPFAEAPEVFLMNMEEMRLTKYEK